MKNLSTCLAVSFLAVFLLAGNAFALTLGKNITIPDLVGSGSGWHGAQEDNEVEPGNLTSQKWDLEGMFLNGTKLSIVGGYDFLNGAFGNGTTYKSGDIFIDVDGNAEYGPPNDGTGFGNTVVQKTFGYDYVLDMDYNSLTYNVVKLDNASTTTVFYKSNQEANPWRYAGGGSLVGSGSIDYVTGLTDTGFAGIGHNALTVDIGFLGNEISGFTGHFAIECGNDNIMGMATPEPATMLLLGAGLVGLAGLRRKFRK